MRALQDCPRWAIRRDGMALRPDPDMAGTSTAVAQNLVYGPVQPEPIPGWYDLSDAKERRPWSWHRYQQRFSRMLRGVEPIDPALGYDVRVLREHFERQFRSGMSWENYAGGKQWPPHGRLWHVDHIVPKRQFADREVANCYALSNLRPLWAHENMRKGAARTHLL